MPLDENLPTFHLAPLAREPHIVSLNFAVNGSIPTAKYTKTRSPSTPETYSTTLHDAFVPDILYASVVAAPEIISPAPSPGGTPQESKVLLPKEFTLQLFNPDSTVIMTHHHSTLRGSYWEFELPKTSFLPPTASRLDAASAAHQLALSHLPRATFRWRKEGGVLSRSQLRCSLVSPGNLGNGPKKAGANEPDIPLAMFSGFGDKKGMGEVTIYQSNLNRVEVEDRKGLEVVLLLGALAIGDMWFCPTNVMFNLTTPATQSRRKSSFGVPIINTPISPSTTTTAAAASTAQSSTPPHKPYQKSPASSSTPLPPPPPQQQQKPTRQDIKRKKQEQESLRREREAKLRAEEAQIRQMLAEEEARERQRREAEVERETQRLRLVYEREFKQQFKPAPTSAGGGGGGGLRPPTDNKKLANRKSFLGLRFGGGGTEDKDKDKEKRKKKLTKKSTMF